MGRDSPLFRPPFLSFFVFFVSFVLERRPLSIRPAVGYSVSAQRSALGARYLRSRWFEKPGT
jgi:hypothetical protein